MARTRAQGPAEETNGNADSPPATKKQKMTENAKRESTKDEKSKETKSTPKKQHQEQEQVAKTPKGEAEEKKFPSSKSSNKAASSNSKIQTLLSKYGALPLSDCGIHVTKSDPSVLLALVFNAMLSSARISHELAHKSVRCLIEAGYHDVQALKKSSWQERTEILTEGGYTRYREKTSTALGELADQVLDQYDGDINNLYKKASSKPSLVRKSLEELKQFGKVGVDIFFDTVQAAWPSLAPFIDPRSMKTAEAIGVGDDVQKIWEEVGKDPVEMCRLSMALTTVRLEKREGEFA